ncbi:response regulator transcription factor [Actinosynnema sp. NPDC059797]
MHTLDDEGVRAVIDVIDKVLAGLEELGEFARRTREGLLGPDVLAWDRSAGPRHRPAEQPCADPRHNGERPRLTRRQQQVLDLLTEGASNRRIARMLHITEQTVKAHLHIVYDKLGASDRTEAVVIAMNRRLVPSGIRPDGDQPQPAAATRAAATSASSASRAFAR